MISLLELNYDMVMKNFSVEMGGDGNATDYVVNLMEYDKSIDAQTSRIIINNGTTVFGNLTVDNVSADHMIRSSLASNIVMTANKVYIL